MSRMMEDYIYASTDSSSSQYARITIDKTQNVKNYFYLTFDLSSIPDNAKIKDIDLKVRLYSTGTSTYCSSRQIRWCIGNGESWINYSQNYSTQSNPTAIEIDNAKGSDHGVEISVADTKRIQCYVHYDRTNRNSGSNLYIYVYGADITVTYELPVFYIKQNNEWVEVSHIYHKENGIWAQKDLTYLSNNNIDFLKHMT